MAVNDFSQKKTSNRVSDLDLSKLLEAQLALPFLIFKKAVVFINVRGIASEASVDDAEHIFQTTANVRISYMYNQR